MARDDAHLLTDLALELSHHSLRPVYRVGTREQRVTLDDGARRRAEDLRTVGGRHNLGQAVVLRLLTQRGELAALAHPDYGSRLHELIGRPNTETTRNLVRLYVLEALQQEPRIDEILTLAVAPVPGTRDTVRVDIEVRPVGSSDTVVVDRLLIELA